MCAIVDNDVAHQIFGNRPTEAGRFFLQWLARRNGGILVAGGGLYKELSRNSAFLQFFNDRLQAGRARRVPDASVNTADDALRARRICLSNDTHVLALAQISGARLLFTNDRALQRDFRNPTIIGGARGRIYTTIERSDVRPTHRDLLNRADLCDL